MTQINDIADLARVLQDHPQWREIIRGLVLGEELLGLPARVTALEETLAAFIEATDRNFQLVHERLERIEERLDTMDQRFDAMDQRFDAMDQRFDAMDQRFDAMDQRFDAMDQRFNRIDGRLANQSGMNYQLKVEKNILSIAGQHLGLRRTRVLRNSVAGFSHDLQEVIENALDEGSINDEQASQIWQTDLIITGQRQPEGTHTHLAAELSITVSDHDIHRSVMRAQILEHIIGTPVIPTVIGAHADEARTRLAEELRVSLALVPE